MAMSDLNSWWQEDSALFLAEALAHINSSRSKDEPISRCDDLCKALNKTSYFPLVLVLIFRGFRGCVNCRSRWS